MSSFCLHASPEQRRPRRWTTALSIILRSRATNTPHYGLRTVQIWILLIQSRFESCWVRSMMQKQVYQTQIHDVNDLKQHLLDVWATNQRIIDYLADNARTLISFYLFNKMLWYVGILLLVEFSKCLESFRMIWSGISYVWQTIWLTFYWITVYI